MCLYYRVQGWLNGTYMFKDTAMLIGYRALTLTLILTLTLNLTLILTPTLTPTLTLI